MAAPHSSLWIEAMAEAAALRPFQESLNDLPSPSSRKAAIMEALGVGLLTKDQTQLLFDVYDLATA